jgi:tetratricopeptide (TPR) repeat protein
VATEPEASSGWERVKGPEIAGGEGRASESRGRGAAIPIAPAVAPAFHSPLNSSMNSLNWLLPEPADAEVTDPLAQAKAEYERGMELSKQGQFRAAAERFAHAVELAPEEAAGHFGLAAASEKLGRRDLFQRHIHEALRLNPKHAPARFALAAWYWHLGDLATALEHNAEALSVSPTELRYIVLQATLLMSAERPQEARDLIEPLIAGGSTDRWLVQFYARLAPSIGQEERALAALARAMDAPGLSAQTDGRPMLHFAAARLLDRMGRFDEAFAQARAGNELVRSVSRVHDPASHSQWVTRKIGYFTRKRLESLPRATQENRRPVFILGMPRSGTSLIEQILASHPAVYGAGELETLRLIAKGSSGSEWSEGEPYPECLDGLSLARANRLAAQYLREVESLAADANHGDAVHITDKQPLNFLILDLVEILFPGCHVIHCIRNPLDTCLSNFITNFEGGNEFKFDLAHLGQYHRDYRRLMEHWKKVLSVPMLDVRYEDVVLDTEGQVRRLLEFLGLPWDERCMKYYQNTRRVRTASEDQVRRPIYTSAIGRWKHYERHLGELIASLGRGTGSVSSAVSTA